MSPLHIEIGRGTVGQHVFQNPKDNHVTYEGSIYPKL